jgi:hypothetical protein
VTSSAQLEGGYRGAGRPKGEHAKLTRHCLCSFPIMDDVL